MVDILVLWLLAVKGEISNHGDAWNSYCTFLNSRSLIIYYGSQQLQGRIIAFVILQQLYNGLSAWNNTAPLYALPDKAWHLSADFTKIRSAVSNITDSPCYNLPLPNKICHVKLHAKSEFTPRYNPAETSIRSIIKEGVFIPKPPPNMYDPPEPHLDVFDAPGKQLDVLSILENGGDFLPNPARRHALLGRRLPTRRSLTGNATSGAQNNQRRAITSGLEPGQGWGILTKSAPDNCDGSWDSFCGRSADNDCLLNGHNDLRGGLGFDSYSGWMIVNLYKVKHGIIIIRVEDWWGPGNVKRTAGWNCENNKNCPEAATKAADTTDQPRQRQVLESPRPHSEEDRRGLGENPNRCSDFTFEFAIDGKVTSWDRTAWDANRKQIQRVAHMWLLMDDSNYTGGEEKDVELAIRLTGCQRETTFGLSHIYWA